MRHRGCESDSAGGGDGSIWTHSWFLLAMCTEHRDTHTHTHTHTLTHTHTRAYTHDTPTHTHAGTNIFSLRNNEYSNVRILHRQCKYWPVPCEFSITHLNFTAESTDGSPTMTNMV